MCTGLWMRQRCGYSSSIEFVLIFREHADSVVSMMTKAFMTEVLIIIGLSWTLRTDLSRRSGSSIVLLRNLDGIFMMINIGLVFKSMLREVYLRLMLVVWITWRLLSLHLFFML